VGRRGIAVDVDVDLGLHLSLEGRHLHRFIKKKKFSGGVNLILLN